MRLSLLSASLQQQKNNCLILNEKHDFLIIVNRGRGKKKSRQRIRSFICSNLEKALSPQRAGSSGADGKEAEAVDRVF